MSNAIIAGSGSGSKIGGSENTPVEQVGHKVYGDTILRGDFVKYVQYPKGASPFVSKYNNIDFNDACYVKLNDEIMLKICNEAQQYHFITTIYWYSIKDGVVDWDSEKCAIIESNDVEPSTEGKIMHRFEPQVSGIRVTNNQSPGGVVAENIGNNIIAINSCFIKEDYCWYCDESKVSTSGSYAYTDVIHNYIYAIQGEYDEVLENLTIHILKALNKYTVAPDTQRTYFNLCLKSADKGYFIYSYYTNGKDLNNFKSYGEYIHFIDSTTIGSEKSAIYNNYSNVCLKNTLLLKFNNKSLVTTELPIEFAVTKGTAIPSSTSNRKSGVPAYSEGLSCRCSELSGRCYYIGSRCEEANSAIYNVLKLCNQASDELYTTNVISSLVTSNPKIDSGHPEKLFRDICVAKEGSETEYILAAYQNETTINFVCAQGTSNGISIKSAKATTVKSSLGNTHIMWGSITLVRMDDTHVLFIKNAIGNNADIDKVPAEIKVVTLTSTSAGISYISDSFELDNDKYLMTNFSGVTIDEGIEITDESDAMHYESYRYYSIEFVNCMTGKITKAGLKIANPGNTNSTYVELMSNTLNLEERVQKTSIPYEVEGVSRQTGVPGNTVTSIRRKK